MSWRPPIWITVPGYRRYAVSDLGQVRNGRGLLATRLNDEGYPKVKMIRDDGVRREVFVHVAVALAHLPPPLEGQRYVLHRNGCRVDATAGNLRWGTHHDNHRDKVTHGTLRPPERKLTAREVRNIRRRVTGAARIARELGLSVSHVREIRNGRKWRSRASSD